MVRYGDVAGFILAGGASSRIGRDKALLTLRGSPLLVRMARLIEPMVPCLMVVGRPERYRELGLRVFPDEQAGLGPLGGIATALKLSPCTWNLILSCDLPFLNLPWLEHLIARAVATSADAVMPQTAHGPEPLCAMYRKICAPVIGAALARGLRKVTEGLAGLTVETVNEAEWKPFDSSGRLFKNINTLAEYEEARAVVEGDESA